MSYKFKYNLETNESFKFDYDTKELWCVYDDLLYQ